MIFFTKIKNEYFAVADVCAKNVNRHANSIEINRTIVYKNLMPHNIQRIMMLLVIVLLYILSAVNGETSDPSDCTNIVCDLKCPPDSKLVQRIDGYNTISLSSNRSKTIETNEDSSIKRSEMIRRKRSMSMRSRHFREEMKIKPVTYIRRRERDLNDSMLLLPTMRASSNTIKECCSRDRIACKCVFEKCPDIQCAPNEYKTTYAPGTQIPGFCCPKIVCTTQKPTCFSNNLKRHFNALERWYEDSCTTCECSETGETNCQTNVCKALNCEKKQNIPGECCPICDTSDSKFCQSDEYCDLHCRNGFERDPISDCSICRCAKIITASETTNLDTNVSDKTTQQIDWNTNSYSNFSQRTTENNNTSSTKRISAIDNWFEELSISGLVAVILILIAFVTLVIIFFLTCRHININRDKERSNRKQNTPLI